VTKSNNPATRNTVLGHNRDGLKTKGNAKLTVLGHNQEHGRTPVAMLECSTERVLRSQCLNAQHREIRMEGRCENVADAEEKWSEVSIAWRELLPN